MLKLQEKLVFIFNCVLSAIWAHVQNFAYLRAASRAAAFHAENYSIKSGFNANYTTPSYPPPTKTHAWYLIRLGK